MAAIGYARVSTTDQDMALQLVALSKAGCARAFEEKASGAKADRPGLKAALSFVRNGDILTVWKLDRLGRSLPGSFRDGLRWPRSLTTSPSHKLGQSRCPIGNS
jgi:DNA invertase Pin-like site-specific DNA recombinase